MMIQDDLYAKMAETHFGNKRPIMALVKKVKHWVYYEQNIGCHDN